MRKPFALLALCAAALSWACERPERPGEIRRPQFALTDQNRQLVRAENLHGKVVFLSFIFTRCPDPNMCPLATGKIRLLHDALSTEENDRTVFVTITLDPVYDRPEVLRLYAEGYRVNFPNHHLLTGPLADVTKILEKEFKILREEQADGVIAHAMKNVLLDLSGAIHEEYRGNLWTPEEVRTEIAALLEQESPG